jgi:hypothetical protein
MKYIYLKITGYLVWGTNDLSREDLFRLKNKQYDLIIDTGDSKSFNADFNKWEDIKGE